MEISIDRPDDWHLHLRDDALMACVVQHTAGLFARALVMPNLTPPVTTVALADAYRQRILGALPDHSRFTPLMTLYLTDNTRPEEIALAAASPHIVAAKLYPAGATTNSDSGVTAIEHLYPALEAMQTHGLVLCVHGEVTGAETDVFDRERVYIERTLAPLVARFPSLRVVLEHLTTQEAVQFVAESSPLVGGTITAHHLLMNRNDLFTGGIRPHHYCLPVLKREQHREALVAAATSGNPKYFLGTDSAPHARERKETACGCAGMYTAAQAMGLYAEAFATVDAIDRLEGFASHFGADFYGLPRNQGKLTLRRDPEAVPEVYDFAGTPVVPLRAGGTVAWRMVG